MILGEFDRYLLKKWILSAFVSRDKNSTVCNGTQMMMQYDIYMSMLSGEV
jgi:hypothetical protein